MAEISKNIASNNKRLAKNTLILYGRMVLTVGLSFYITRTVLENLGVKDYGLYNVIGGFVSMFYMVTTAMSSAITRFITFEIGTNNKIRQQLVFSTSINIQLIFAFLVILLGETLGLWFVNTYLQVGVGNLYAANVIYQISLLSFIIELIGLPFYCVIIANEKMSIYAYVTIINVILNLIVALLIPYSPINKIIFYALSIMIVGGSVQLFYALYCTNKFRNFRYKKCFDKTLFKQMFNFGGWNIFTSVSSMLSGQGVNILLNTFYGTVVNAAYGITRQLNGQIQSLSKNFLVALYPQIVKSYSEGDYIQSRTLVYKGTKYSFLLICIIGLPLIIITEPFLRVWLKEVPEFCSTFVRLAILLTLTMSLLTPTNYLNHATGQIKRFQLVTALAQIFVLPISFIFLKLGYKPYTPFVVSLFLEISTIPYRIVINKKYAGITMKEFSKQVLLRVLPVFVITLVVGYGLDFVIKGTIFNAILIALFSVVIIITTTYFIALEKNEKNIVKKYILRLIPKKLKNG